MFGFAFSQYFFSLCHFFPAEGADAHFQPWISCEHTKSCPWGEVGCWLPAFRGIPEPQRWAAAACWTPPPSSSWWTPSPWPFESTWTWLSCPQSALSCSAYGHPRSCDVGNERFVIYPEHLPSLTLQISARLMRDERKHYCRRCSPLASSRDGLVTEEFWRIFFIWWASTRWFLITVSQAIRPWPCPVSGTQTH